MPEKRTVVSINLGNFSSTGGIMRAISEEERIVCLTNNHGEVFYDYELLFLLDDAGYTILHIDLYKDPIPENCEMIISYNPNTDLIADSELSALSETEILDAFLSKEGNSFWVFGEDGTPTARSAKILRGTPMDRFVDASELLGATLFLCDERSASAITGVVLPVDCGFAAYSGV